MDILNSVAVSRGRSTDCPTVNGVTVGLAAAENSTCIKYSFSRLGGRLGPARHLGGYSAVWKRGALLQQENKQFQHAVPLLGSMHPYLCG